MATFYEDFSRDIGNLLHSGDGADVIFQAGEKENYKEFRVHSLILRARSSYFETAFSENRVTKVNGTFILKKPNISGSTFMIIFRYLYTAVIDMTSLKGVELLKLFIASDELNLQALNNKTEAYYRQNEEELIKQDPIGIIQTLSQHKSCSPFKEFWLDTVCANPFMIFDTDHFTKLDRSFLITILERNDLNAGGEIVVWRYLLQWCAAQVSITLNISDPKSWNPEDFNALKEFFRPFIPIIRWFQINQKDFGQEIFPFEGVLPKDLREALILHHLNSDSPPKSISVLPRRMPPIKPIAITSHIFATIASWIDQKDIDKSSSTLNPQQPPFYDRKNNPYDFNLVHCADFGNGQSAHAQDMVNPFKGSHPMVVIIRPENSNLLIGRYDPYLWRYNYKTMTSRSFLFSFENPFSLIGNIARPSGIDFGFGSWDLCINYESNRLEFSSYRGYYIDVKEKLKLGDTLHLSGGSYRREIYQVIKK